MHPRKGAGLQGKFANLNAKSRYDQDTHDSTMYSLGFLFTIRKFIAICQESKNANVYCRSILGGKKETELK